MNTGLQDAYNLAWKLALVAKGHANEALLDTYEAERIPVAQRLLSTTDRAFMLVVSDSWIAALFRTRILARIAAFVMTFERARRFAFLTISQTGISYPESPLSKTLPGVPENAPRAGERFPWLRLKFQSNGPAGDLFQKLDDTCFNLVVIGQPAPVQAAPASVGLLRTIAIPGNTENDGELARAGITGPRFYLLRPDGHIGLAGTRLDDDAVTRYLSEIGIRA